MPDIKILIVDDQRSHLRMMKQMVEQLGCKAVTVDSPEEAGLILDWNSGFDAIVTDLKMPWMDGVEFCADIKRKYPKIRIFALSGNLQSYNNDILNYAGFDGIYQKPVTFDLINGILALMGNGDE